MLTLISDSRAILITINTFLCTQLAKQFYPEAYESSTQKYTKPESPHKRSHRPLLPQFYPIMNFQLAVVSLQFQIQVCFSATIGIPSQ